MLLLAEVGGMDGRGEAGKGARSLPRISTDGEKVGGREGGREGVAVSRGLPYLVWAINNSFQVLIFP